MHLFFILVLSIVSLISTSGKFKISNKIIKENEQTGTNAWWYRQTGEIPLIQGFTTKFSFEPGDSVDFKVDSPSWMSKYSLFIFRLGYYGGSGGRFFANITVTNPATKLKSTQPECHFELLSRLVDCSNWQTSSSWKVPQAAVSGIYVALPVYRNNTFNKEYHSYGSYIPFVVRQPKNAMKSELLFKTSDLTWVAYNKWGNWNVYRGNGSFSPSSRAYKASYNRPWQNRRTPPEGHHNNFVFASEFPMLFWLERMGYDVSYAACADLEDLHRNDMLLEDASASNPLNSSGVSIGRKPRYKAILSIGHDEYWTPALKLAHEYARENGIHLAFFSGNEVYWRTLWEEETFAAKNRLPEDSRNKATMLDQLTNKQIVVDNRRIIVCRKETVDNVTPASPEDWTGTFRDPRQRPAEDESLLTGQWFLVNAHRRDAMSVTAEDSVLRFWRNASFVDADTPEVIITAEGQQNRRRLSAISSAKYSKNKSSVGAAPLNRTIKNDYITESSSSKYVYTSPPGVLGYEWDVFPEVSRPHGLFPMSTTKVYLTRHLVQEYGAYYKGTGNAIHRLSMYRHYARGDSTTERSGVCAVLLGNASRDISSSSAYCSRRRKPNTLAPLSSTKYFPFSGTSALVFGAGTIQWSWGLSDWHDGNYPMRSDRDMQQATLNLFADFGVLPIAARLTLSIDSRYRSSGGVTGASKKPLGGSSKPLVFPSSNTDIIPPKSRIESVRLLVSGAENVQKPLSIEAAAPAPPVPQKITHAEPGAHPIGRGEHGHGPRGPPPPPGPPHGHSPSLQDDQHHKHGHRRLTGSGALQKVSIAISGTAQDFGGGAVSAVEVSLDGGRTWFLAEGRKTWTYVHTLKVNQSLPVQSNSLSSGEDCIDEHFAKYPLFHPTYQSLLFDAVKIMGDGQGEDQGAVRDRYLPIAVLSRAVDDGGWVELTDYDGAFCEEIIRPLSGTTAGEGATEVKHGETKASGGADGLDRSAVLQTTLRDNIKILAFPLC